MRFGGNELNDVVFGLILKRGYDTHIGRDVGTKMVVNMEHLHSVDGDC